MNSIDRNLFLKKAFQIGALVWLNPLANVMSAEASPGLFKNDFVDDDLLQRLSIANDRQVSAVIKSNNQNLVFSRRTGYEFAALSASYSYKGSKHYKSSLVISALEKLTRFLLEAQAEDGTVNIGNLESPPDTAFLLEPLTAGASILSKENAVDISGVKAAIKNFIVKAANALATGGVHTPNHRWVICAALAQVNALYPDKKYTNRIDDWLGEGIFIDSDGHFPERSRNYDAVENASLITMGRLLHKPELFEPATKNLDLTYYYTEPNGDLVTTDSRRQDQYGSKSIVSFYLHYRYLAITNNNSKFAAIAGQIEGVKGFEEEVLNRHFFHFLENPLLQKQLPSATPPPVDYEKLFTTSHLLRIRRGNTTATLFGGVDWPLIIASGRSNSPDFFSYRKGAAILKYMRLSSSFFSTGYFYSDGLRKEDNKYILYKKLEVPYYQPLPKGRRNAEGDYKLSPSTDGRFWNKMDFENRPVSNVKTLETKISLLESNGRSEVNINVTGQAGVPVTIELCFKEGGRLSGVTKGENENSFLEKGMGRYEFGEDRIEFGPGTIHHREIRDLEGERYSTHFGNLRTEGMHVFLTGVTPFKHKLVFS